MTFTPSIGIVIPTFRAAKHLPYCLPPLLLSSLKPRILVIDSSSDDETVTLAKQFGVETLVIPQSEFNHGTTREKGRRYLNTDIVVMITQDAVNAISLDMLEKLVEPLINKKPLWLMRDRCLIWEQVFSNPFPVISIILPMATFVG